MPWNAWEKRIGNVGEAGWGRQSQYFDDDNRYANEQTRLQRIKENHTNENKRPAGYVLNEDQTQSD